MRWLLALALLAFGAAWAQEANPVLAHFRAYRAALEAGDLATAEASAEQALAASVARDGDGGVTGVLAMNLAQVRLDRGRTREALEPAQRANAIAIAGNPNLDPLVTRLALSRAQLAVSGASAAPGLLAALTEAEARGDLATHVHAGASELGRFYFEEEDYADSRRAWAMAARAAEGSPAGVTFARGEARLNEAVSLILFNFSNEAPDETGSRLTRRRDYEESIAMLEEALRLLGPMAHSEAPLDGLTQPQQLYGTALAWRGVLWARLPEGERNLYQWGDISFRDPAATGPICTTRLIAEPEPNYPPGAVATLNVGAVAVRLVFDDAGELLDTRVAGAVPRRGFADAVERVAGRWRVERAEHSPANCYMPRVAFVTMHFTLRNI